MKRASVLLLCLAGLARAADAVPEDLTHWQFYAELPTAKASPGQLCDFIVPPWVFGRAQASLDDLRLCDPQGRAVPYALRVRTDRIEEGSIQARAFNRSSNAEKGTAEVSLDLGETPREHTAVVVNLTGADFRRDVRVEGSDDGMKWKLLEKGQVIRIAAGGQLLDVRRLNYPPSRFRYVRVQVSRDPGKPEDRPGIESAEVLHSVRTPGELRTITVVPGQRQGVRTPSGTWGSAWLLDLGDSVPVDRVLVWADPNDGAFNRPYRLEIARPGQPFGQLTAGEWRRQNAARPVPLEIRFPSKVLTSRLRLEVTDSSNPPLNLKEVKCAAPARQVVFRTPEGRATPLRLYYGNPSANPPNYDFAATLPAVLDPAPVRLEAQGEKANPEYMPPPKPWSERYPWLVDAVLGVAGGVLLVILGVLGRQAIRRYDLRTESNEASQVA